MRVFDYDREMNIEVIWESGVDRSTGLNDYIQILEVEGSLILDVTVEKRSFFKRIIPAIKYIFKGVPMSFSRRILRDDYRSIWGTE